MNKTGLVIAFVASLLTSFSANAEWVEVFHMQLKDGCTAPQLQAIGDKLTKKFGRDVYTVEIMANQHGAVVESSVLWLGRSPSAKVWGEANDLWAKEGAEGGEAGVLFAEITQCVNTLQSGSWRTVR